MSSMTVRATGRLVNSRRHDDVDADDPDFVPALADLDQRVFGPVEVVDWVGSAVQDVLDPHRYERANSRD